MTKPYKELNLKAMALSIAIIFILTVLGGLIVGISGPPKSRYLLAAGVASMLMSTVGFTISGVIIKKDRFIHLFLIAVCVWILGLLNVIMGQVTFSQWVVSLISVCLTAVVGGGLSYLFRGKPKEELEIRNTFDKTLDKDPQEPHAD